jgi:glutathione reductase (NADPH)
VDFL